jgi:hypothetical protein
VDRCRGGSDDSSPPWLPAKFAPAFFGGSSEPTSALEQEVERH